MGKIVQCSFFNFTIKLIAVIFYIIMGLKYEKFVDNSRDRDRDRDRDRIYSFINVTYLTRNC